MTDINQIAKSLSDAQRRAILGARDCGPFFVVDFTDPWTAPIAEFLTLHTDRLTPLGLQVRTHLLVSKGLPND